MRRNIEIDGREMPFTCLQAGERWVAVRRQADLTVTISAANIDPASLQLKEAEETERELLQGCGGTAYFGP